MKLAAEQEIPLCCDVVQSRTGPANIICLHFDWLDDLTFTETQLVTEIMRNAARQADVELYGTIDPLRFAVEQPKKMRQADLPALQNPDAFPNAEAYEETRAAGQKYFQR